REPLVLYYYEGRSVDDVARSLGISSATMNKRLSRGRRYLADRVSIVERDLTRHGPRPGLAAAVLAIIGITGAASHVGASPRVKGSTMQKLSIAALLTATLGGATALVITDTRSDAKPRPTSGDSAAGTSQARKTSVASSTTARHDAVAAPQGPALF